MKKQLKVLLVGVSLMLFFPSVTPLLTSFSADMPRVLAKESKELLSLGASLSSDQETMTRQYLGAVNTPTNQTLRIDGNTINRYLRDGSNSATGVYSSAFIIPQAPGYGVQIQVVTPQNITMVTPTTYQNAAITSGAKDVLIRIATPIQVTGEGALVGVYALLEKTGQKIDNHDVDVAGKEIKVVQNIQNITQINNYQINQIISQIKIDIVNQITNNTTINADQISLIVMNQLQAAKVDHRLNNDLLQELLKFAQDFAETDAARRKETIDQLQVSVIGSGWEEILTNQEGSLTVEQALQLKLPDYQDADRYHPIIPALLDHLMVQLKAGDTQACQSVYSHTFIVEKLQAPLSQEEYEALNYIRALCYQVLAGLPENKDSQDSLKVKWLRTLDQARQIHDNPAMSQLVQAIAFATGYAPEAYNYQLKRQSDNKIDLAILSVNPDQEGSIGEYQVEFKSEEDLSVKDLSTNETLIPVYDFKGDYGVEVEDHSVKAPIPVDYQLQTMEESREAEDQETTLILGQESSQEMIQEEASSQENTSSTDEEEASSEEAVETSDESSEDTTSENTEEVDPVLPSDPLGQSRFAGQARQEFDEYFYNEWSKAMGQSYLEYGDTRQGDFNGLVLAQGLDGISLPINGSNLTVAIDRVDQTPQADVFYVVSVRSDMDSNPEDPHVYLLGYLNGEAHVLVNQGNALAFADSQNADLSEMFSRAMVDVLNELAVQEGTEESTPSQETGQEQVEDSSDDLSEANSGDSDAQTDSIESSQDVPEEVTENQEEDSMAEQQMTPSMELLTQSLAEQASGELTFFLQGMNVPQGIFLTQNEIFLHRLEDISVNPSDYDDLRQMPFNQGENYSYQLQSIPSKEIRIFSADQSGIRTVQVDTRINLLGLREDAGYSNDFYLFINRQGKLTLVTPNFAGNVSPDESDVMLEYPLFN